jgi:hypothetical protein
MTTSKNLGRKKLFGARQLSKTTTIVGREVAALLFPELRQESGSIESAEQAE